MTHSYNFGTPATTPKFWGVDSHDLHCWVELDGKILDYPVSKLEKASLHGTKNLKYVAFKDKVQPLLEKKWRKDYEEKARQLEGAVDYQTFWVINGGFCFYRSIIIADRLKSRGHNPKIVYGSLGFVQKDGSVFYEYG